MRSNTGRVTIEIDLSDIGLDVLIEYVGNNVSGPGDVFDDDELEKWARAHGWVEDVEEE